MSGAEEQRGRGGGAEASEPANPPEAEGFETRAGAVWASSRTPPMAAEACGVTAASLLHWFEGFGSAAVVGGFGALDASKLSIGSERLLCLSVEGTRGRGR